MQKLILATRNKGKLKEIKGILNDLSIEINNLSDYSSIPEVVEDGETLEENALKKAREIFHLTGIPTLADDTGLEVLYLGMAPGVISARYAGEKVSYDANNRKLLKELKNIPPDKRTAQFRCVAAFIAKDIKKITEGICHGKIIDNLRGTGGFGYDPLFVPDGYDLTFAELPIETKNHISHRAKAFQKMKLILSAYFSTI
jgi:XTP/dITP diphosphohydrolase